jgi:hypothetical protein
MTGRSALLWGASAALAAGVLYHTSQRVQTLDRELRTVERAIVAEREAIHVLRAEWAHLNDPTRLQRLAGAHSGLEPMAAAKIGRLADVPERPPEAPAPGVPLAAVGEPSRTGVRVSDAGAAAGAAGRAPPVPAARPAPPR